MHHHRPEAPMPRSLQMRQAAAAAAAGMAPPPLPPPRTAAPPPPPFAPANLGPMPTVSVGRAARNNSSIDYGKYKTKLCRNFVLGLPCPFEARCVFAHGEDQLAPESADTSGDFERPPQSSTSVQSNTAMEFPRLPSARNLTAIPSQHNLATPTTGSDDEMPSPPTYESFLAAVHGMDATSPNGSEPASPITPVRYRHDPYRPEGIVVHYY